MRRQQSGVVHRRAAARHRLNRIASVAVIVSMITVEASAAPRAIIDWGGEARVSLTFWYHTSGWAKRLSGLIGSRSAAAAPRQESQGDRDARVASITVYPPSATIKRGDREFFGAIASDANGEAVGGVKVTWEAHDETRNQVYRMMQTGEFSGKAPGVYVLTARAGGHSATATVTVLAQNRPTATSVPTLVKEVSSRDLPPTVGAVPKNKGGEKSGSKDGLASLVRRASLTRSAGSSGVTAGPAMLRVRPFLDEEPGPGWDASNYLFADDPDNDRGRPPGRPIDQGVGSANFELMAPILNLPGRGLDLSLNLVYNSRVWTKTGSQIVYDMDRDWIPGWSLGFGRIAGLGTGGAMLIDADGTRHGFSGTVNGFGGFISFVGRTTDGTFVDYSSGTDSSGTITTAEAKLSNGTVVQYGAPSRGAVYPTRITDANGNYISVQYKTGSDGVVRGPKIQFITDTLGRTINFFYGNGNLTAITTPGVGGGTRTLVRLHYATLTLNYGFSGLTAQVNNATPTILDAIYYPGTGTGYWFGDSDSYSSYGMLAKYSQQRGMGFSAPSLGNQGTVTQGLITSQCSYDYPLTPNFSLTDAPTYTTKTETWEAMDTAAAITHFVVQKANSTRTTTITHPDQTKSVQYSYDFSNLPESNPDKFKDGLIYQDDTLDVNNVLVNRSKVVTWAKGYYDSPRPVRTEETDERNQTTAAEFDYGPLYNQVNEVRAYDYGGVSLLRKTNMAYQNGSEYTGRHIFNLVRQVTVFASDSTTRVSRVLYEYDGRPLGNTPGVVQHDVRYDPFQPPECHFEPDPTDPDYTNPGTCDPNLDPRCDGVIDQIWVCGAGHDPATDFRGNVTSITRYVNAAALTGEITDTQDYDITGNRIVAATSCCEQTSTQYSIDNQYAYPISQTRGSADPNSPARVTISATNDFNTGLIRFSTDANQRTTQTDYFADTWRPQTMTAPTLAYTTMSYDDVAMSVTESTYTSGNSIASLNIKRINGQGQVRREEALGQNGVWDLVETKYDILSRVWKQTRPFNAGTPLLSETTYDALGRVKTVTGQDGSQTTVFYNESSRPSSASAAAGQTVRTVDPWGREKWARTNADGRLAEVVEPNPQGNGSVSAAGNIVTTYNYDTLGNLIQVLQGVQQRTFKYDSIRRLTNQKMAEESGTLNDSGQYVGVGAGSWSEVFTYDDRSNLVSQTEARGVKTIYTYSGDPLNRLQSVTYDTSGFGDTGHPILSAAGITYEYMTAGDKTRLFRVTTAGVSTEDYGYDSEGRLSSRTLTMTSRLGFPMVTDYINDSLDRVGDVRYPAEYGMAGSPRKLVHHDFDVSSRISGLKVDGADYASQIVYNPSSQVTSLKVGASGANQVTENYTFDDLTGLLTNQTVQRGGSNLLDLTYDYLRTGTFSGRTGQLTRILNNLGHSKDRAYEYDMLGRLTKATGGQPVTWTQNYVYDRYGNRTTVTATGTTGGGTSLTPPANLVVTSATTSGISLSWSASPGADHYQIERRSAGNAAFQPINSSTTGTSFSDSTVTAGGAYVYRVKASDAQGNLSGSSNTRLGVAKTFTDPTLVSGVTVVKAAHVTEMRDAVNAVRTLAGLSQASWTDSLLVGVTIKAVHVEEMRTRLTEGLQALTLTVPGFTNPSLAGVTVKKVHIDELRGGLNSSGPGDGGGGGGSAPIPMDGLASVSYDQATNRINTTGWEYDAAGNQTRLMRADGSWQRHVYDAAGRLVKVQNDAGITQVINTFGASNHRLIEQVGNESSNQRTYSVWGGNSIIAEYEETAAAPSTPRWTKSFVYLEGRLLATLEPNGASEKVQYHHPDRLGTRLVSNASDTTVIEQVTLPYGTALNAESTGTTKRRFTSYDRSAVSGLDYAVNRHYDSLQGRFTQVDPIALTAANLGDPQSLNLYTYAGNDPINQTDPEGLFSIGGFFKKLFGIVGRILKWISIAITVAVAVISIAYFGFGASWALKAMVWMMAHAKLLSAFGGPIPGLALRFGTPTTFPGSSFLSSFQQQQLPPGYTTRDGALIRSNGQGVFSESITVSAGLLTRARRGAVAFGRYVVTDPAVRRLLTDIADFFGRRVIVTSGDRDRIVNGNPRSHHLLGRAADFHVEGVTLGEAYRQLREAGIIPENDYQFIWHTAATCAAHLHLGHYPYSRRSSFIVDTGQILNRCGRRR